jgi:hypothetical protein
LNHHKENILERIGKEKMLRNMVLNQFCHMHYLSQFEPKKVEEAQQDESWMDAMHKELNQFISNDVWTLVHRPIDQNVIGTKWNFKNKSDEHGTTIWNKARLIA